MFFRADRNTKCHEKDENETDRSIFLAFFCHNNPKQIAIKLGPFTFESIMIIHGTRNNRTITSKTYSEGSRKSFTEYLSPASDKGTKMLKLEGQLGIYSPSADRIIQISGHLLRQSVMGSDLSYEDMMDDRKLTDIYSAEILGEEKINDRVTWLLELTAKVSDVAYHSQKMWIDIERYIPVKQELYGKSGQLLKRTELSDVRNIQGRWFPTTVVYKDMLKEGSGSTIPCLIV